MVIEPTYGTRITFVLNGNVWQSSDRYFKAMPYGVNNVVAKMELRFDCDKDDLTLLRQEVKNADGTTQLSFDCPLENFYKRFRFFGDEMSVSSSDGDLFTVDLKGESTMSSPICSDRGQFIDLSGAFDGNSGTSSRIKYISGDLSEDNSLEVYANDVVFYENYDSSNDLTRSHHNFWDHVFFAGSSFYNENGREAVTISSQSELTENLTKSIPLDIRKKVSINSSSAAFKIEFSPSFRTRIKSGINQVAWDGIELSFDNVTDQEAFLLTCFCEARLGFKGFDFELPEPYDKCTEYIILSWSHEFVDENVNLIKIQIQPRFKSYKDC